MDENNSNVHTDVRGSGLDQPRNQEPWEISAHFIKCAKMASTAACQHPRQVRSALMSARIASTAACPVQCQEIGIALAQICVTKKKLQRALAAICLFPSTPVLAQGIKVKVTIAGQVLTSRGVRYNKIFDPPSCVRGQRRPLYGSIVFKLGPRVSANSVTMPPPRRRTTRAEVKAERKHKYDTYWKNRIDKGNQDKQWPGYRLKRQQQTALERLGKRVVSAEARTVSHGQMREIFIREGPTGCLEGLLVDIPNESRDDGHAHGLLESSHECPHYRGLERIRPVVLPSDFRWLQRRATNNTPVYQNPGLLRRTRSGEGRREIPQILDRILRSGR